MAYINFDIKKLKIIINSREFVYCKESAYSLISPITILYLQIILTIFFLIIFNTAFT